MTTWDFFSPFWPKVEKCFAVQLAPDEKNRLNLSDWQQHTPASKQKGQQQHHKQQPSGLKNNNNIRNEDRVGGSVELLTERFQVRIQGSTSFEKSKYVPIEVNLNKKWALLRTFHWTWSGLSRRFKKCPSQYKPIYKRLTWKCPINRATGNQGTNFQPI